VRRKSCAFLALSPADRLPAQGTTSSAPGLQKRPSMRSVARRIVQVFIVGTLAIGCATGPRPRAEAVATARMKDSGPEKIAAHRADSGNLRLDREDDRWGIEAAKQRRHDRNAIGQGAPAAAPGNGVASPLLRLRERDREAGVARPRTDADGAAMIGHDAVNER
jgi:hypothetical protein